MKLTVTTSTQLSTQFKSLRKAKGWSQADLGRQLGIGQARVAQIERDPGAISVDKFFQILHLLDTRLILDAQVELPPDRTASAPATGRGLLPSPRHPGGPALSSGTKKKW